MNLTSLRYVSEVDASGSITNAARNLSVSQPNLSKIIKDLEIELEMELFIRSSKGVTTTKAGKAFIEKVRKVLKEYEELEDEFLFHKQDITQLDVAIPRASYVTYAFTRFIRQLDKSPDMCMRFIETNSLTTIEKVADHSMELGIIRYEYPYEDYFLSLLQLKNLTYELVMDFEYQVVLSSKHELAGQEELCDEDLQPYVEILHGDTVIPSLAGNMKEYESDARRKIYIYERGSQFDLLASDKQTYMWVSPIPEELLKQHHLVQKRCTGKIRKVKDLLVYPKDRKRTPIEKKFIEEVQKVVQEMGEV